MGRRRLVDSARETTTTRIYADTLRIIKVLAEIQGMNLIDYADQLARRAAVEDGPKLLAALANVTAEEEPPA